MIDIVLQIIAVLAIFIIATHFISKRKNVQTYWHIVSMIKSKRFIPLLDRFVVFKKALSFFATLGLISGFGIIAIDFLYAKKIKLYFLLSFPAMTKMYNAERPTSP